MNPSIRFCLEHALNQGELAVTRSDVEILLAHTLQQPREYLHTWPERELTTEQFNIFSNLVDKRRGGWPVAYLTGRQAFWNIDLRVSSATLIPRPETELLVETALTHLPADANKIVIDLGTGSGAIALAIAKERPQWQIHATDISPDALAIARDNAQRNAITNVAFYQGDWVMALPSALRADMILSNPPYIAVGDPYLRQGDLRYEPVHALTSGPDGLDAIRQLLEHVHSYLKPNGLFAIEHGYDQAPIVRRLFGQHHFTDIMQFNDLAGHVRVTLGKR